MIVLASSSTVSFLALSGILKLVDLNLEPRPSAKLASVAVGPHVNGGVLGFDAPELFRLDAELPVAALDSELLDLCFVLPFTATDWSYFEFVLFVDEPSDCSLWSSDRIGEGVAKLDRPEVDSDGDGVRVLLRFLKSSPLSRAGVLVLLATAAEASRGDEAEAGCLRVTSVADKLFVLLVRLRDLLSFLGTRILGSSGFGFELPEGLDILEVELEEWDEREAFLFWLLDEEDLLVALLDLGLLDVDGLGLLLTTAVRTLSFLAWELGVLLPDRLASEGGLFVLSDLTEVSSTDEVELFSLAFLVPAEGETSLSVSLMSEVCLLKSAEGVDDWVILRLADGGCMVLVGVLWRELIAVVWFGVLVRIYKIY
jgi:hypothetical protein